MLSKKDKELLKRIVAAKQDEDAKEEAATSSLCAPLLRDAHEAVRPDSKMRLLDRRRLLSHVKESAVVIDGTAQAFLDGIKESKVKVVLITEGLGNRRDMNYYGPEAIDSAPLVFEGKPCFLDHPSYSDEKDIPERRVHDKCGYFKNCSVETIRGTRAMTAELHFDLSESGRLGYDKALSALHYQREFPGSEQEYVGLSINADGEIEERALLVEGEQLEVNYVTRFTDAMSCDIVTLPARGGKFLALVESAAGASLRNKEVRTMVVKRLQAAQTALKEAITSAKTEGEKKKLAESLRHVEAVLKEAINAASESEKESEAEEAKKESEAEESEKKEEPKKESESKEAEAEEAKKKESEAEESKKKEEDCDDKGKEQEESKKESVATESDRLAVEALISKSELDAELFDVEDLAKKGLTEAKAEIARVKRLSESLAKKMMKVLEVNPVHFAKMTESGKPDKSNNDLFSDCSL